jgi:hypothetical protein
MPSPDVKTGTPAALGDRRPVAARAGDHYVVNRSIGGMEQTECVLCWPWAY